MADPSPTSERFALPSRAWHMRLTSVLIPTLVLALMALKAQSQPLPTSLRGGDGFYFLVKRFVGRLMDGHAGARVGHSSPALATPLCWPFVVTRLDGH